MPLTVNLSYPKTREILQKSFSYARTDNATEKCWLPKDAIIVGVTIITSSACDGTTGTLSIGFPSAATEIVNAYNVSTGDAGMYSPGAKAGATVIAGTKLTADKKVISTFTAGDSTAGGAGFVILQYVIPGPGEGLND